MLELVLTRNLSSILIVITAEIPPLLYDSFLDFKTDVLRKVISKRSQSIVVFCTQVL